MTAKVQLSKPPAREDRAKYVERAELLLAASDHRALATMGLVPDPLQHLAAAFAHILPGETADVAIDLVPVSARSLRRRRRKLLAAARRRGPSAFGESLTSTDGAGALAALTTAWTGGRTAGATERRLPRMTDVRDAVGKFTMDSGGVFAVQILLRVTGPRPERAAATMHQLLAAFAGWGEAGENRFTIRRPRRTEPFDRRFDTGEFTPRRRQWLTAREMVWLLKPPTAHCHGSNIERSGGLVPPAPSNLPVYTGQPDLYPLGAVTYPDGIERFGAVPIADLLFALQLGKSGYGKTEAALLAAIGLAHSGHGEWFLDPHGEAWARAKPFLAHEELHDRVWELDFARPTMDQRVATLNLLSMEGRSRTEIQEVVGAVVGAVAAAQEWGEHAPRARTLLACAVEALCEVSLLLVEQGRPDLQPTIFQVRSWLVDDAWRENLLPLLPQRIRKYWRETFQKMDVSAVPTVTYVMDRLDTSVSLRAFLGSPRSTYDVRKAMDTGKVVFVCPSGSGETDALISCLLIHDLYRAGRSRQDTPRHQRRTFFAHVDELKAVDGSSKGFLAAIAEQLRKYEVRLIGMTQMAMRLSPTSRQALLQNQSLLSTCAADYDEAAAVTRRWNGHVTPETVTELGKYEYVMSMMLRGERTKPFRVRGIPVDQAYAAYDNPDGIDALDEAIDRNLARRPVQDILADLDQLDDAILRQLRPPAAGTGDLVSLTD